MVRMIAKMDNTNSTSAQKAPVFRDANLPSNPLRVKYSINNNRGTGRGRPIAPGLPCDDDEEVQAVPRVSQVAFLPKNPQCDHLDNHFHSKEGKDEIVKALQKKGREEGCACVTACTTLGQARRDLSSIRSPLAPPRAKIPKQRQH